MVKTPARTSLTWITFAILVIVIAGNLLYSLTTGGMDFSVYRTGAMALYHTDGFNKPLYDIDLYVISDNFSLPFTYPPFAAMLFSPFAWMPKWAGILVMMFMAFGVSWWLATVIYNFAQDRGRKLPLQDKLGKYGTIALLTAVIILSGPWRRGLGLVQINPLIMLLVLADLLRPATKVPRGVLIGIAGGIKLTPLAFGLILLMRKDLKGVITLGITFAVTIAIGFIFMAKEAKEFWFSAVSDSSRVGNINYPDNVSIQGWLMHLGTPEGGLLKVCYLVLMLALLVGTAFLIPQLHKRDMVMSEIALNAFLMVQMSPISWSHHNTWFPLLIAALWIDAFPVFFPYLSKASRTAALWLTWIGAIGLYISPLWLAIAIKGNDDDLDNVPYLGSVLAGLPVICLFIVVMMWIYAGVKNRKELATA